jgi:hypothetical protein
MVVDVALLLDLADQGSIGRPKLDAGQRVVPLPPMAI